MPRDLVRACTTRIVVMWKGQVGDSGYPPVGFTNSELPTRSREALCILFATNELKFLLDA